jgi:hypothetical protein
MDEKDRNSSDVNSKFMQLKKLVATKEPWLVPIGFVTLLNIESRHFVGLELARQHSTSYCDGVHFSCF